MYNNIGSKIKGFASTLTVIGMILSCISGLVCFIGMVSRDSDMAILGLIAGAFVSVIGCLIVWLANMLLYGFGELVDKTSENNRKMQELIDIERTQLRLLNAVVTGSDSAPMPPTSPIQSSIPVQNSGYDRTPAYGQQYRNYTPMHEKDLQQNTPPKDDVQTSFMPPLR